MTYEPVLYFKAYQRVRQQRQNELKLMQRQLSDYAPLPRLAMGAFAMVLGAVITLFMPPIGAVLALVGLTMVYSSWRLWGQAREIRKVLADENFRWALRDEALAKIGEKDFATLCRSVEGKGSYESLSGWLIRKNLTEAEVNALILSASVASEEVVGVAGALKRAKDKGYVPSGMDAAAFAQQQHEAAFGTASQEGLHARELAEADAATDAARREANQSDGGTGADHSANEANDEVASMLEAARQQRRQRNTPDESAS